MGSTMILATLTLSIIEVVLLFFAAVIVGITIHFTITSRRYLRSSMTDKDEVNKQRDEWKLRYFNDIEVKDKELAALKEQLSEAEENTNIYSIEAEEMRKENKKLLVEIDQMEKVVHVPQTERAEPTEKHERPDYFEQLRLAQESLMDHNEKINQLLGNIDAFKETEEKQREMTKRNEELSLQITELHMKLSEKEKEVVNIKKKEHLTKEMTSMLDNAYSEFNVLQSKMQKLESQANSSKLLTMEYEDLKESHRKMTREFEEQKIKLNSLTNDHQQIQGQLAETEDKLREANFQRQQLQKRVVHLEELNSDLQAVSDANKKLEVQLKRIGELESMLNMAAEEREQLIRRVEK
jgi:chromosome segregation ATPase